MPATRRASRPTMTSRTPMGTEDDVTMRSGLASEPSPRQPAPGRALPRRGPRSRCRSPTGRGRPRPRAIPTIGRRSTSRFRTRLTTGSISGCSIRMSAVPTICSTAPPSIRAPASPCSGATGPGHRRHRCRRTPRRSRRRRPSRQGRRRRAPTPRPPGAGQARVRPGPGGRRQLGHPGQRAAQSGRPCR